MLECAPASERDGIRPVLRNVRGGGRRRVDLRSLDEPAHERLEILARQGVIVDKGWKCSVERRGGRPDLSIAISQRQRVEPRRQRSRRPRVLQPHLARARRVRLDDARRLPDREDQAAERGRRRRELFRRREQHQLAEVLRGSSTFGLGTRGDAVAATWIFRGDGSHHCRDVRPWTSRGDAVTATWIVYGRVAATP